MFRRPNHQSAAIMTTFQITGARYDSRNFRWLLRTPRHHAEQTSRPMPGNMIRTSRIVSSRFSPVNPIATVATSHGVRTMPSATSTAVTSASSAPTTPATRSASSRWPRASNPA